MVCVADILEGWIDPVQDGTMNMAPITATDAIICLIPIKFQWIIITLSHLFILSPEDVLSSDHLFQKQSYERHHFSNDMKWSMAFTNTLSSSIYGDMSSDPPQ